MSTMNTILKHTASPVVHAKGSRKIEFNKDNTKTKCGIELPTRILGNTPKPVTCPVCKEKGN